MKTLPRPFALTQNKIDSFKACPRRGYLHYIEGLVPRHTGGALALGAAFHRAVFTGDVYEGQALLEQELAGSPEAAGDALKILSAVLHAMVSGYDQRYGTENVHMDAGFDVPLINPQTGRASRVFRIAGRFDGIVNRGGKYIVMMETASRRAAGISPEQAALQLYAARQCTGGDIAGVICRTVRKPGLRQRRNESAAGYCTRIACDYRARPEFYFEELVFDAEQLESRDYIPELWQFAKELLYQNKMQCWYRNTARCADRGGCPYQPLCAGQPGAAALYEQTQKEGSMDDGTESNADQGGEIRDLR